MEWKGAFGRSPARRGPGTHLVLMRAQDTDTDATAATNEFQQATPAAHREQHHRRLERKAAERGRRDRVLQTVVLSSGDGDTGSEAARGLPVRLRADAHPTLIPSSSLSSASSSRGSNAEGSNSSIWSQ